MVGRLTPSGSPPVPGENLRHGEGGDGLQVEVLAVYPADQLALGTPLVAGKVPGAHGSFSPAPALGPAGLTAAGAGDVGPPAGDGGAQQLKESAGGLGRGLMGGLGRGGLPQGGPALVTQPGRL